MRLTTSYDVRHPVVMAWVRFVSGAWLVVLTALLCSIGDWWGAVLAPLARRAPLLGRAARTTERSELTTPGWASVQECRLKSERHPRALVVLCEDAYRPDPSPIRSRRRRGAARTTPT